MNGVGGFFFEQNKGKERKKERLWLIYILAVTGQAGFLFENVDVS